MGKFLALLKVVAAGGLVLSAFYAYYSFKNFFAHPLDSVENAISSAFSSIPGAISHNLFSVTKSFKNHAHDLTATHSNNRGGAALGLATQSARFLPAVGAGLAGVKL